MKYLGTRSDPLSISTQTNSTLSSNSANGYQALYSNTTGSYNTANGYQALYSNTTASGNVANGYQALYLNTTGAFNIANGYQAVGSNTTGSGNVANGYSALGSNTTGSNNIANGYQALYSNTTASGNTANGAQALYTNTTGLYNIANGYQALYSNTTASGNTANGYQALYLNTTGAFNIANGYQALGSNTTGSNNIANGYLALGSNIVGYSNIAEGYLAGNYISGGTTALTNPSNSIFIGTNTQALADNGTNEIVIGYGATGSGSNTTTIGNTSTVSTILKGNLGLGGVTTPTYKLSFSGQSAQTIWSERNTTTNTAGNDLTLQAGGAAVGATNANGGTTHIRGGISTGTGTSTVSIETYVAGTSGTADDATQIMVQAIGNKLGLFGATPVTKPTVTGSKASGAALISLLSALVSLGLITDSTTT